MDARFETRGRRECLKKLLLVAVAASGAGPLLSACGSSSNPSQQPGTTPPPSPAPSPSGSATPSPTPSLGSCSTNGTSTMVIGDALHMFFVSAEDVAAGVEKSYHIQGRENHDHILTLTAQDFAALQKGQSISMDSGVSFGGVVAPHFHTCVVACA